ncbi:MAG TPA: histidine--tRNA ligase [Chitinophagaceae bacterium]|nr:histidine--tRNA ligase [Chitinophagaceae bacterium]
MKPSLPQGTRDFGAEVLRKRQYILANIRAEFELYGFEPLETPALENLETLMGKYGDEGDKLIFKILNNGLDNPAKKEQTTSEFEKVLAGKSSKAITERALKYDLTIPFARYVAMNHGQLLFPFKRYQMQPVWRADRPQKGRYREFYQCDADVVGSHSLLNEIEFVQLYDGVLKKLGLENYELRINSRKLLTALAEQCGGAENMLPITIAIDKLDKIGLEKVKEELAARNLTKTQINIIETYLSVSGENEAKLETAKELFAQSQIGLNGIAELETILNATKDDPTLAKNIILDFTLARGLNYYTGVIFEAKAPTTVKIGSIGGGGRYDDLTGLFGVPNMPGVGISFGVDRIYDVLEELNLFPAAIGSGTTVLIFNAGNAANKTAYGLLKKLRAASLSAELYHEEAKADKQFKYAEKKKIPYIIREINAESCVVKNIQTGAQQTISTSHIEADTFRF